MNSGIYAIVNLLNGKFYIGSAKKLHRRIWKHRTELNKNKHHNKYLQRAFNKNWGQHFEYIILEYCEIQDLESREQWWFDLTLCYNEKIGYNILQFARSNLGYKVSNEAKEKLRIAHTGKKLSAYHKEHLRKINLGNKHSKETRIKMNNLAISRFMSKVSVNSVLVLEGDKWVKRL